MYYFIILARGRILNKVFVVFFIFAFINNIVFAQNANDELRQKAYALYNTGNFAESKKLLEKIPSTEKDAEIFLLLSNIALEQNHPNIAIQNLNKALEKDNTYYKAYYNLGLIFANKKQYILAQENFKFALKYNKTSAPLYYNLARCQMELKDYSHAKKNLIKALELNPKDKDTIYNLALCYKELKQTKQAEKMIESYNKLS